LAVAVRLTPNANAARVDGITTLSDDMTVLAVRVPQLPQDGRANAALLKLLAKEFGVAKTDLSIAAGQKSRVKRVVVTGDPVALAQRLENWFKSAR